LPTLQQLTLPAGGAPGLTRWRPVIGGAARMLAQGVPLAALLFLFVPRLSAPLWGLPADHVAKTGLSERMTPGFISELSLSDAVAFRVDFDREPPPPAQRYWRGPVLSEFDGEGWSISGGPAPGRFERSSRDTVAYTVTLEPHDKLWLFALEFPAALPVATGTEDVPRAAGIATLSSEQQLLALAPVTQPMQYRQVSRPGADFPVGDRARLLLEQEANRRLPPGFARLNPRTVALARELRDRFADDDALARAVLDHFHAEPFVYTLTPPRLGRNAQDAFLFDTRRGFCEHYASAFVFLLRAAGVPARVVTGYQGGEMNPRGNYMIVRQSDAHAWAEALIDGRWRRFDPTAAVSPSRIEWGLGGALPFGEPVPLLARLDSSWQKSLQLAWDAVNHDWRHVVIGFNRERQQSLLRELALDERPAWHTAALISGLCASWLGALLGWLTWKKRRRDPVHAVWSALGLRLARAGLPREPQEGPLAYMDRATRRWPEFAAAFGVIGAAYAQLRYGAEPIDHADQQRRIALSTLKRALQVLPRARRLARMNTLPFKPVEGT
jgi:transglutaminase-like putative cysteine protease